MINRVFDIAHLIYNNLSDEQSRYIFTQRILFNITGDSAHIANIAPGTGRSIVSFPNGLFDLLILPRLIGTTPIIYGGGFWGREIFRHLKEYEVHPRCFWDNNPHLQKSEIFGVPVLAQPDSGKGCLDPVIICVEKEQDEIVRQLLRAGFAKDLIINPGIKKMHTNDALEYFEPDIIKYSDEEVFVDGGSYELETTLEFLNHCKSVKRIYAFECDTRRFDNLKEKMRKCEFKGIKFIPKGLWNVPAQLKFQYSELNKSGIIDDNGTQIISATSIDNEISEHITFIKLDIEGAELMALKGAKNSIMNYKPKLAICVYHKLEDIIEIPAYILSLAPDYKLFLRHYTSDIYDTILYAV